ncbi:MAG: DMT family transporter [Betaproteobacteria bacterium]|nr:MAG: DMT family transporter [Betaproteobacteria bacterium]
MRPADYGRLVLLAAIWGAAFIFMRVAAPALGAIWTAELRVLLGGAALLAWFRLTGYDPQLRRHARAYLVVGSVNIALPFVLYSYAAMHAPASLLAIINATAPMFGLVWGALFRDERVTLRKVAGLALGAAGVAFVARPDAHAGGPLFAWAVAAALAACCAYGLAGVVIKRVAQGVPSKGMAAGNQLAAALVLLPLLPLVPPAAAPSWLVLGNVLALALLASGVAFVLYFRLIADVGATRALTVTFLIPAFGLLWGGLFLGEALPAGALAGAVLIVAGTALVTRG